MHPAFFEWLKTARRGHGHGPWNHEAGHPDGAPSFGGPGFGGRCGPGWAGRGRGPDRGPGGPGERGPGDGGFFAGGPPWGSGGDDFAPTFGVRRPLRFLAHKLELDEAQTAELARILDELKTERAQAEVDHRRTVAAFADAMESEAFDGSRAGEGAKLRVESAERVKNAVVTALSKLHALLDGEQRKKLAYLVRTGVVSM